MNSTGLALDLNKKRFNTERNKSFSIEIALITSLPLLVIRYSRKDEEEEEEIIIILVLLLLRRRLACRHGICQLLKQLSEKRETIFGRNQ